MSVDLSDPFASFFGAVMLFVLPYIFWIIYRRCKKLGFIDQITDDERPIKGFLKIAAIMAVAVFVASLIFRLIVALVALLRTMFRF